MVIISLLGGLGLFIYGMKIMGDGLENAAGEGLKNILEKVTKNPIIAVVVGAIVTAVIQSSSATTVMVVGFVNAGLMNLAQAAGIIMGANIGTTITAQLVAFKLTDIAPLFVFGGAMIVMFAKMKKKKEIGNIILGFGILFIGMGMMSESMEPLRESAMFQKVLLTISDKWYLGVIAGALITAVLQSSSATTGILVALANAGAISIAGALPIVLGCNIGTCITAMLSTVGTNKTAHRAAMMHLIFNVTGTVIFLPLLATGLLADIVSYMSPVVSKQIANAHTIFNITNTIIQWIGDESRVTANKLILNVIKTKAETKLEGLNGIKKALNVTLGSAFKATSKIITNDDGLQYLDTLKDGNGRYILQADPITPMSMWLCAGATKVPVEVIPNSDMPSTGNKAPFIIGDLKEGIVFWDRQLMSIKMSDIASIGDLNAFEEDLTLFRAIEREVVTKKDEQAFVNGYIDISAP